MGRTLDVLLRKIGLLRDAVKAPLAGRMLAVLDLASRLPRWMWCDADLNGHDARFLDRLAAAIPTGALVVFDFRNSARSIQSASGDLHTGRPAGSLHSAGTPVTMPLHVLLR